MRTVLPIIPHLGSGSSAARPPLDPQRCRTYSLGV